MVGGRWVEAESDSCGGDALVERYGIPPLAARLILHGGRDGDGVASFLEAERRPLPDPARLPDMAGAVRRIRQALGRGEGILVHGDYDVDGLMGTAILAAGLRSLGGRVTHFIPSRFDGGYGLSEASLGAARAAGATLIVTVDCGTNPGDILNDFERAGISLVVTDHHVPQPGGMRPEVFVNAHAVEGHPDAGLCGASVAMQVVREVARGEGRDLKLEPFLRLAALATVADVAPMTLVNRGICRAGFASLADSPSPGLARVCLRTGVKSPARSCHVGYGIAPLFNAAGRMGQAGIVVDMLLERDPGSAHALVARLESLNGQRKSQQNQALELSEAQAEANPDGRVLVVCLDGARFRGVAGPVAARLAEKYARSTFVMAREDGEYTGSARAANGDDLTALLALCAPHLVRFGGHESAAGFTLKVEALDAFRACLAQAPPSGREPAPEIYHRVEPCEAGDIWKTWGILDPFGPGAPEPILGLANMVPVAPRVVKDRHLIWEVDTAEGRRLTCIYWDGMGKGITPSTLRRGQIFLGRPVPENRGDSSPFFFQVRDILD